MWSARLRDPSLNLLDDVKFSTLTLIQNYNAPATLAVTGRLDNLRVLMQPGYGLVVRNSHGQQFSGRLTSAQRKGDGTATAIYTSDLVRLWDRVCYPGTTARWDNQTLTANVVTGTVEDRILDLVNRNAGPAAWYSGLTGTDPGEDTTFTPYKTIIPNDRDHGIQSIVVDPLNGDMYMFQQPNATSLAVRRLDIAGVQQDSMSLPGAGHGDVVYLSARTVKGKRQVYLTFRYGGDSLSHDKSGTWVRLPYTKDKTWKAAAALVYKTTAPRSSTLGRRVWCQGETIYNDYTFRLYGTPYNNTGSTQSAAIPAFIEVIRNNKIVRTVPCAQLGRGGDGLPYDGHLEPNGLSIVSVAGQPSLLVGISTGRVQDHLGGYRLYTLPLKPDPRAPEDRRIYGMRMPTTFNRGQTGTTTVRFDILGPLVAKLAESADLAVDLVQAYDTDGTPYLKFTVVDTPDMSDSIRIGPASSGGPVVLGDDWSYTDAIPTISTGLTAAGGAGSERILRSKSDPITESIWGARIEGFIDQSKTTDLSEIDDGIDAALDAGTGPAEISIPLGRSSLRFGIDIPLGARMAAVLDGEPVVDRIRQITTTIASTSGAATETTTAILGSPDASLKTPTQKALAAMLRRIQNLERN